MQILTSEEDRFGGCIVSPSQLPQNPAEFSARLAVSLSAWRSRAVRVVWLAIPLELSALVPPAVAAGFRYHHATDDQLQLTLPLTEGAYIPPYATHYVGAGGFVLREDGQLLVVEERYRRQPHFKLPGGALHPDEHIADAVRREVLEETGIETRFESLVCFRHWHGYRHGKSDIYFVCRLTPCGSAINHDPKEISKCVWMPVEAYLTHPAVHAFNRRIARAALSGEGLVTESLPGYGSPDTHELFMPAGDVPDAFD